MKHLSLLLLIPLILSGCTGFDETFDPAAASWSAGHGPMTLAIRAYKTKGSTIERCDNHVPTAILMPDTAYYRDWMRILDTKSRFQSQPTKQARDLIRTGPRLSYCTFIFKNIPPGHYIFRGGLEHAIPARKVMSYYVDHGFSTNIVSSTGPESIWGSVDVPERQGGLVIKQLIRDDANAGNISSGDWAPPADEMKDISTALTQP